MTTIDRRRLLKLTGAGAAAALAAGCTPKENKPEAGNGGTLEFIWPGTSDPETAVANDFKAASAKDGQELKFNFLSWADMQKQLSVRIQANDAPDLTMTQDVTDWVTMKALRDLTSDMEKSGIKKDSFRPGSLEYSTIDGKSYSIPYSAQTWSLVINKKLAQKAGIDPASITSYEAMLEAAKKLTSKGQYGFCIPMQNPRFAFRTFATAAYANGFNPGDYEKMDASQWQQTLEHLKAMTPYRPAADRAWAYPEMFRSFAKGETAMIAAGSFFTANIYELNPDVVADALQLPYPKGPSAKDDRTVPVSNAGFAVFEKSKDPKAGWKVLDKLVKPEWQARLTAVAHAPASKDIGVPALEEWIKKYYPKAVKGHTAQCERQIELVEQHGLELQKIPGQPAIEPEFQMIFNDYVAGKTDAAATAKKMGERFKAVAS